MYSATDALTRLTAITLAAATLTACASSFKDPGPITFHSSGARPRVDASGPPLQCVPFARNQSGVNIYGDAHTWWDQARRKFETDDSPSKGAVMVIQGYRTDKRAHVAVVRKILDDRELTIDHANWANPVLAFCWPAIILKGLSHALTALKKKVCVRTKLSR